MEFLTKDDFLPHVGKSVRFKDRPQVLVLDRVEVSEHGPPPGFSRDPFLVIFRGDRTPVLDEGSYDC